MAAVSGTHLHSEGRFPPFTIDLSATTEDSIFKLKAGKQLV